MRNAMQQDVNRMRKTLKDAVFPLKDPHGMGGHKSHCSTEWVGAIAGWYCT